MIPESFFHYLKINENTLLNLINSQIYFNHVSFFNDPFEFPIDEIELIARSKDIIDYYNLYLKENEKSRKKIGEILDVPSEFIESCDATIREKYIGYIKENYSNLGVFCLSSVHNNILMWSHYGDGHKGICLEFDSKMFEKAFEVKYSDNYPRVNPFVFLLKKQVEGYNHQLSRKFLAPLLTKYKDWKYEKEWRVFHKENKRKYLYNPSSLKAVYFGILTDTEKINTICSILRRQNSQIKLFKAKKNIKNYLIDFEELELQEESTKVNLQ